MHDISLVMVGVKKNVCRNNTCEVELCRSFATLYIVINNAFLTQHFQRCIAKVYTVIFHHE
jgi:hypothetical protein